MEDGPERSPFEEMLRNFGDVATQKLEQVTGPTGKSVAGFPSGTMLVLAAAIETAVTPAATWCFEKAASASPIATRRAVEAYPAPTRPAVTSRDDPMKCFNDFVHCTILKCTLDRVSVMIYILASIYIGRN